MTTQETKILRSFKAQAAESELTNVKKDDSYKVLPEDLHEEPGFNERDYNDPVVIEHIERLAKAYAAGSPMPPLIVRIDQGTGLKYIVDGHCRTKAALLAKSRGVPLKHLTCMPFRGNDVDRVACMLTSAEGLKLRPVGIARGYLKLYRLLKDVSLVADQIQRTTQHVEAMLLLAQASTDVQEMVNNDQVAASTAIEVIRAHGDNAGEELTKLLAKAKASGKTKVKPSAFREWVPPRKQATQIYASIGNMVKSLESNGVPEEIINAAEGVDPQTLAGQVVTVDASALVQLIQAFKQAEKLKAKRSGTDANQESDRNSETAGDHPA